MHSNIYSSLFRDANIEEENIIDSHAAWTEANAVTSLQIKAYCDYWVASLELEKLNIISKHLYHN